MVRFPSAGVQGAGRSVDINGGRAARKEDVVNLISPRYKSSALTPDGQLLVFAPPLVTGFLGAPLALALSGKRAGKIPAHKNWAKRRAYAG
jgi:hypothetical protein